MDPAKFSKWIYKKMDKCLTFMHDSSDASPEYKQAIEDTILGFYDMAMTYNSDRMAEFQLKKAFATETWFEFEPEVAMAEYEKAFAHKHLPYSPLVRSLSNWPTCWESSDFRPMESTARTT